MNRFIAFALLSLAVAPHAFASSVLSEGTLRISGMAYTIESPHVVLPPHTAGAVRTAIGGATGADAPKLDGVIASAWLTGPGLLEPIVLETEPGHDFLIPPLAQDGNYLLQNVRLERDGATVMVSVPAAAVIEVTGALQSQVTVRQITPEELRERGISLDARNYDLIEFDFSFSLDDGQVISVPYPVAVDRRSGESVPISGGDVALPDLPDGKAPPRWTPPRIVPVVFAEEPEGDATLPPAPPEFEKAPTRVIVPAAIVMPGTISALHEFFDVDLIATNSGPLVVTVMDASARLSVPPALRVAKTEPAAGAGARVRLLTTDGSSILGSGDAGSASWVLEGLASGTHALEFDLTAIWRVAGQDDIQLRARPRAAVTVHDPRVHVALTHPDTVRANTPYFVWVTLTNQGSSFRRFELSMDVQPCSTGVFTNGVCIDAATPPETTLDLQPGEMRTIPLRLISEKTGSVIAAAGDVEGEGGSASMRLVLGVSESGVLLSPKNLSLPSYVQYLDPAVQEAITPWLGIGYSLATAPLTSATSKLPRVLPMDVNYRTADLARAGQSLFIAPSSSEAAGHVYANLMLDLLGNSVPIAEWDQFHRREPLTRPVMNAIAAAWSAAVSSSSSPLQSFAVSSAHRLPHAAVNLRVSAPGVQLVLRNDARREARNDGETPTRELPWTDVIPMSGTSPGALGINGRWQGSLEAIVINDSDATQTVEIELLLPSRDVNATGNRYASSAPLSIGAGESWTIRLERDADAVRIESTEGATITILPLAEIAPQPLAALGARQDPRLDAQGRVVSVLFNRPIAEVDPSSFETAIDFTLGDFSYSGRRMLYASRTQPRSGIAHLTYEQSLSPRASYELTISGVADPLGGASGSDTIVPIIDLATETGAIRGIVRSAVGETIAGTVVHLSSGTSQRDVTDSSGQFFFEAVPLGQTGAGSVTLWTRDSSDNLARTSAVIRDTSFVLPVTLQFLGRGSVEGHARLDDGTPLANLAVRAIHAYLGETTSTTTDSSGRFVLGNLALGPHTLSVRDDRDRMAFAVAELRVPGERVARDLTIVRDQSTRRGSIRGVVLRSDDDSPVAGALVGVQAQGFDIATAYSAADGTFAFDDVPAGLVAVQAAEWSISRVAAYESFTLAADSVDVRTLRLAVSAPSQSVRIEGVVTADDPAAPGDPSRFVRVRNPWIRINGMNAVAGDENGVFVLDDIPASMSGRTVVASDPASGRSGSASVPTLNPSVPVHALNIHIPAASGSGTGTIRVRLLDATGAAVAGYRVFEPSIESPLILQDLGNGVYEAAGIAVGRRVNLVAVPPAASSYGDQWASSSVTVEFSGHVATGEMRLPGQGTLHVRAFAGTSNGSTIELPGDIEIVYSRWDEAEQGFTVQKRVIASDGVSAAIAERVPARLQVSAQSVHPQYGTARARHTLRWEGDSAELRLDFTRLATVRGRVFGIDGRSPVPGATVRLLDGRSQARTIVADDTGAFELPLVPAGVSVEVRAEATPGGIWRTGRTTLRTPSAGGDVDGVAIVLMEQGRVTGRVVDHDGDPLPGALFWARELDFPARRFGSADSPLVADADGRFSLGNLMRGTVRVEARHPSIPADRGSAAVLIDAEDSTVDLGDVAVGDDPRGDVRVQVVDPNADGSPVEGAEVRLYSSSNLVDATSSSAEGEANFTRIAVGSYRVDAWVPATGRAGSVNVQVIDGSVTEAVVSLQYIGSIGGLVIDPDHGGAPVAGLPVTARLGGAALRASSDEGGEFLMEGARAGTWNLDARDLNTNREGSASATVSEQTPSPRVTLALEQTSLLHVRSVLADDYGAATTLDGPPLEYTLRQRCVWSSRGPRDCDYERTLQGVAVVFDGVFRDDWHITGREMGGHGRTTVRAGAWPEGSAVGSPVDVALPVSGSVEALVVSQGSPVAGARVRISSGGFNAEVYSGPEGRASFFSVPLGSYSVQASLPGSSLSGSASGTLQRASVPAHSTVEIGGAASIAGRVLGEDGMPAAGAMVNATFASKLVQLRTNAAGQFLVEGVTVPAGSSVAVDLVFKTADDVTTGATRRVSVTQPSLVDIGDVRLDATPPAIVSIVPGDGQVRVQPDTSIRIRFSEAVAWQGHITWTSSSGSVSWSGSTAAVDGGGMDLVLKPSASGQAYPLASNTLYQVVIGANVQDGHGNRLGTSRVIQFMTSDYAPPSVVDVYPEPQPSRERLLSSDALRVVFSEPIDRRAASDGGTFALAFTNDSVLQETTYFFDATGTELTVTPVDSIAPSSRYALELTGVRDLDGNAFGDGAPLRYEWISFDETAPSVVLTSPLPAGIPLTSGVGYTLVPRLLEPDLAPSTDVRVVDYFHLVDGVETFAARVAAHPFSWFFMAPDASQQDEVVIRARATDTSGNESAATDLVLQVQQDAAPSNLELVDLPASVFAGASLSIKPRFFDEGTSVSVSIRVDAERRDGSVFTRHDARQISRADVAAEWVHPGFSVALSPDLAEESPIVVTLAVTDAANRTSELTQSVTVAVDTVPPVVTILEPAADARFVEGTGAYIDVVVEAADEEVAVESVQARLGAREWFGLQRGSDGRWSGSLPVPFVDGVENLTESISVEALDYAGNSGSASVAVVIEQTIDPDAPSVVFNCPSVAAIYPTGTVATVTVTALPAEKHAGEPVAVRFRLGADGAEIEAAFAGENRFTASVPLTATQGTTTLYAFARYANAGADPVMGQLIGETAIDLQLLNAVIIPAGEVISSTDTRYDGKTVAVTAGTVTIDGAHTFERMMVLNGATIKHSAGSEAGVQIEIDAVFIECGAAIDVSGRGYRAYQSYPGASLPTSASAGSHMGRGGLRDGGASGETFGSVTRPRELGGGQAYASDLSGGGRIEVEASSLVLDGLIAANAHEGGDSDAGAGGSIWIRAGSISGAGAVQANGNIVSNASGGGGAIALEYEVDAGAVWLTRMRASTPAYSSGSHPFNGGAGTIYVRGPENEFGTLTIDNNGTRAGQATELPSLGGGVVLGTTADGAILLDRSRDIPPYFIGHWVEVTRGDALMGTYRIQTIGEDKRSVTLADADGLPVDVMPGDQWQGVYRFDRLIVPRGDRLESGDPIRIGSEAFQLIEGPADGNGFLMLPESSSSIRATEVEVRGRVMLRAIEASRVTLVSGAVLTHPTGSEDGLQIAVTDRLLVEAGAAIDVSGRGYRAYQSYPGASLPTSASAGSHMGRGGVRDGGASGETFGSVTRPRELGGGQAYASDLSGGGRIEVEASSLVLDGLIAANAHEGGDSDAGAGGSIWIRAGSISGAGAVQANGNIVSNASGGGGAIALEYEVDAGAVWLTRMRASTPAYSSGSHPFNGGAGTIYVRGPENEFGTLTIDNNGTRAGQATELPSLGGGVVLGTTADGAILLDRSRDIPPYFIGHWVEVTHVDALMGTYRIQTIGEDKRSVTLADADGLPVDVMPGDQWQGVYRFDSLIASGVTIVSEDLLRVERFELTNSTIAGNNLRAPRVQRDLIRLEESEIGALVTGEAAAVADDDVPVVVRARNSRTNSFWEVAAAENGSFAVGVQGEPGDEITLTVRDSNFFPRSVGPFEVGVLQTSTPTPTTVPRTEWAVDSRFRPRALSRTGDLLAVWGVEASGTGGSDHLVLMRLHDSATPSVLATYKTGRGWVRDVTIQDGWALVAADDLVTFDLSDPAATPRYSNVARSGSLISLAVGGGYAFGMNSYYEDIEIHDVASPASSRFIRAQKVLNGVQFSDLIPHGGEYLIGLSSSTTSSGAVEHDVVVIDRRDVMNLGIVSQLSIPEFSAIRGRVEGSLLYVAGADGGLATVDLTDIRNPQLVTRTVAQSFWLLPDGADLFSATRTKNVLVFGAEGGALSAKGAIEASDAAWAVERTPAGLVIAHDSGLDLVAIPRNPLIERDLITMSRDGGMAVVAGAPGSVSGNAPLSAALRNTGTGAQIQNAAVTPDGSFLLSLPGEPGEVIELQVTDGAGRTSGWVDIGPVPYGESLDQVVIGSSITDSNFRARRLAADSGYVIVASRAHYNAGGSPALAVYEAAVNSLPSYARTLNTSRGNVWDVVTKEGWAYVAADDLVMFDLADTTGTPRYSSVSRSGALLSLAVDRGYAFGMNTYYGDIEIHDVSSPVRARYLRSQKLLDGVHFSHLLPYGNEHLIGISTSKTSSGSVEHDVAVVDRRDVMNLKIVSQLAIPSFDAFRGRVDGTKLYLAGLDGGAATVDLTDITAPRVVARTQTNGRAFAVERLSEVTVVADASSGVTFIRDGDPPDVATHAVGGTAWDVVSYGSSLFAVNELGLVVVGNVSQPPYLDASRVHVSRTGSAVTVAGGLSSATGAAPLSVRVRNVSLLQESVVAVGHDGSFTTDVPGEAGQTIVGQTVDASGRSSDWVELGRVPYGESVDQIVIGSSITDVNFRARRVAAESGYVVVASRAHYNAGGSPALVVYDVAVDGLLSYARTLRTSRGNVWDVVTKEGWTYVAADDLVMFDLADTTGTARYSSVSRSGGLLSVAVDGGYAFGMNTYYGDIEIHDVAAPASARYLRSQKVLDGVHFSHLLPYGNEHLIGISTSKTSGGSVEHDVVVVDRRDVMNLRIVSQLAIPSFDAFRGRMDGTMLYLAGLDGGTATVDLTDIAAPYVVARIETNGRAFAVERLSGITVVADASSGLTFVRDGDPPDVATEVVGGTSWDVVKYGSGLFAVNELGLVVVGNVSQPPHLDPSRVHVSRTGSTVTLAGSLSSATGAAPLTVRVRNASSAQEMVVNVGYDGSFSARLSGEAGDTIVGQTVDASGRSSEWVELGRVPYGESVDQIVIGSSITDVNFRSRLLAAGSGYIVVASRAHYNAGGSPALVVYDLAADGLPSYARTLRTSRGNVWDVVTKEGWAYLAADDLVMFDLADTTGTARYSSVSRSGGLLSVAVDDGYAFGMNTYYGDIEIHDVSSPASPRFIRGQVVLNGVHFTDLILYGSEYLVGLSSSKTSSGTVEHDVVVIDRRDVTNLKVVSQLAIPAFEPRLGRMSGSHLYVAGVAGGVAILDLTNVTAPVLVSRTKTAGLAFDIELVAPNRLSVADATGLLTLDVSDPANPAVLSREVVMGQLWGLSLQGNELFIANDVGLARVELSPPEN